MGALNRWKHRPQSLTLAASCALPLHLRCTILSRMGQVKHTVSRLLSGSMCLAQVQGTEEGPLSERCAFQLPCMSDRRMCLRRLVGKQDVTVYWLPCRR